LEGATYDNGCRKNTFSQGHLLFRDPDGQTVAFVRGSDGGISAMIIDGVASSRRNNGYWTDTRAHHFLLALRDGDSIGRSMADPSVRPLRFQRPLRKSSTCRTAVAD